VCFFSASRPQITPHEARTKSALVRTNPTNTGYSPLNYSGNPGVNVSHGEGRAIMYLDAPVYIYGASSVYKQPRGKSVSRSGVLVLRHDCAAGVAMKLSIAAYARARDRCAQLTGTHARTFTHTHSRTHIHTRTHARTHARTPVIPPSILSVYP
jgi:hypothetical protein